MKLKVNHLVKSFENKQVLRGVTFTFEQGRIYGLLGRNGAGKTTFFNCVNDDLKIDGGSISLEQNDLPSPLTPQDVGYVLSTPVVPEFLTAREFLKFFIEINQPVHPQPLDSYFDFMKIAPEDRDRLLKDYSHGMKNKMQMLINICRHY